MSTKLSISKAADLFTQSYARAMALSASGKNHSLLTVSSALGAHYVSTTTAYTCGLLLSFSSPTAISDHLSRFDKTGLGYKIQMENYRVERISEANALCWITWKIDPRKESGVEEWSWENVYAYRREIASNTDNGEREKIGGEGDEWDKPDGWWECIFGDNEILGVLQRAPNFMDL